MKPLLVAHRGDPKHAPENTLKSFEQAIFKGAQAIEVDVRRLKDGLWVAFHDENLHRMTGVRRKFSDMSLSLMQRLRARGEPIPSLAQVLKLCRQRRVGVFLDVKESDHEKDLWDLLQRSGGLSRILVGAGEVSSLRRWRRLLPRGRCPWLFWVTGFSMPLTSRRVAQAKRWGVAGLAVYRRWVTQSVLKKVRTAGLRLFLWTVRTPRQLRRFAGMGVDGIMSEVWPPSI